MKKQIPNMLSVLRLFMVPLFFYTYFEYTEGPKQYIAVGVYVLAWLTDALDGYLARRNNWITDVGKILDPVADKLMQFTAALCFTIDNSIFLIMLIPLIIKEIGMLFGTVAILKRKKVVVQASWYGKVATVLLFGCALLRLIIRDNATLDVVLCVTMLCVMLFSITMYYVKDFKGKYDLKVFRK